MAISDKKKVSSFLGVAAEEVAKLKATATRLEHLRTLWAQHAPDTTGTPLDGHVAAVSGWIDDVRDVADAAVPNGLAAYAEPTHMNMALGEAV